MVDIEIGENGPKIGGYSFHKEELEAIQTRIERDEFGDQSKFGFGDGLTLLRDGDTIKLVKPKGYPEESWSYKEWVRQSDGWKVFEEGPRDEWLDAFDSV